MPKHTFSSAIQTNQRRSCSRGYAKGKVLPFIPHYTTINIRINRLNIKVEDAVTTEESSKDNYVRIAIDSTTGIKVTNRGQWLRDK